jgi:N-acetylneuraminic acid mutarotase
MLVPWCYFACGIIAGKLYVAGGYNGCGELEVTGEVYDFETNEWPFIAPMPFGLAKNESDAFFKGRLFIKGRALISNQRKVVSYNPVDNTWENNEKLERSLLDGEFVAMSEELYVMNRSNYIGQ